jgi:hypothetical protein
VDVKYRRVFDCIVCGHRVNDVVQLPDYPITDIYVDVPEIGTVDQTLAVCPKCGHAQLTAIVDPELLYSRAYAFRTTVGGSVKVNDQLLSSLGDKKFDRIVEVGCNDCYLLNTMRDRAPELIGIDPVLAGRESEFSDTQLTAIGDFAENVPLEKKDNTLYITSHVMEHLTNPRTMLESLIRSAGKNCLFVFQFPGFDSLLQDYRFDQVYNHHLHYFSLYSIIYLIEDLGCRLLSYSVDPNYWGTLLVTFEPSTEPSNFSGKKIRYEDVFSKYINFTTMMSNTNDYLESFKGDKIYGYGAALQVPVLSYHLRNDMLGFECIIDDDIKKDNKYFLNLPVRIRHSSKVGNLEGAVILITAHNFSRRIIPKLVEMNPKRIILPNGGI